MSMSSVTEINTCWDGSQRKTVASGDFDRLTSHAANCLFGFSLESWIREVATVSDSEIERAPGIELGFRLVSCGLLGESPEDQSLASA